MSIFSAKKRKFPMNIKMMEKHSLGSQAFIPMEETTFLVFVAPKGKKPNIKKLKSVLKLRSKLSAGSSFNNSSYVMSKSTMVICIAKNNRIIIEYDVSKCI
jgi:hypothetical protein